MKIFAAVLICFAVTLVYLSASAQYGGIVQITEQSYANEVEASVEPVLMEFEASWCPYCRKFNPLLEKFHQAGAAGMKVVRVDIDREPALADKFSIRLLPTLLILSKGNVIERHDGSFKTEEDLADWAKAAAAQIQ